MLIVGIVAIVACVMFLLFAILNLHAYHNLYDATAEHYKNLYSRMTVSFIIGTILAVIGAACFIIRTKI